MNLKGLVHRELGEGLTEAELASAVEVSVRTIVNILADKLPQDRAIWEKFARYFRLDVDFLRTGASAHSGTTVHLPGSTHHSAAGEIRKIPLLSWDQIGRMVAREHLPGGIHAEAMVETTDVAGTRTFALKVQDDSMEPLFSMGEMIFVNPEQEWGPGDYVIAKSPDGRTDGMLLRQVKSIGSHSMFHPLNRKYDDLPLTNKDDVRGKIVRLRKNL
ncbi:MAG: hypothetical protein NTNFB02_11410 [Nitrospira sp.]